MERREGRGVDGRAAGKTHEVDAGRRSVMGVWGSKPVGLFLVGMVWAGCALFCSSVSNPSAGWSDGLSGAVPYLASGLGAFLGVRLTVWFGRPLKPPGPRHARLLLFWLVVIVVVSIGWVIVQPVAFGVERIAPPC